MTPEDRQAAARRRILTHQPKPTAGAGGGGGDAVSSSSPSYSVNDETGKKKTQTQKRQTQTEEEEEEEEGEKGKLGFEGRMALHAWNLKTVHPRAGTALRLAVDMPDDMAGMATGLGLNVESVMLGTAAAAAAAAGVGPARVIGEEHAKRAKRRTRRVRNTGRSSLPRGGGYDGRGEGRPRAGDKGVGEADVVGGGDS